MTEDKIDNGNEESALIDSNIIYTSIIGAGNAIVEPAD